MLIDEELDREVLAILSTLLMLALWLVNSFALPRLFAEGRFHAILKGVTDPSTGAEKTGYMVPLTVGLRWAMR